MKNRLHGQYFILITVFLFLGCAGRSGPGAKVSNPAQCTEWAQTGKPMLAGWSTAQKASLESLARSGVAVVAYDGCSVELLEGCRLPGGYTFEETSRARETVSIRDRQTLGVKLPVGADDVASELDGNESLDYSYVTSGTKIARISGSNKGMLEGNCDRGTHFVQSMVVGAFELAANSGSESAVFRQGGNYAKCKDTDTASKSEECQAIIQLVLLPISEMTSDRTELYEKNSEPDELRDKLMALAQSAESIDPSLLRGDPPQEPPLEVMPPEIPELELSETSKQIKKIPEGGSDPWDDAVAPIMVSSFDKDGSKSIDTPQEVLDIPCDVLVTLDRSIRIGRGGVSSLRSTYGFPDHFHWVGYALGFDQKIRSNADKKIEKCGLL